MLSNIFACRIIFFVVAFYVGLWTIRVPTIKDQVGTDYLGIGYILAAFALGSVLFMILSNKIIKFYSSKYVIELCGYLHAVVWILAASLPAAGSVNANAPSEFPDAREGRYFFFCSSVPNSTIGVAHKPR